MNSEYYYIKHSEQLKSDLLQSVAEVRQAVTDFSQTVLLQDKHKQKQSVVFSLIDIDDDKIERQAVVFFNDAAVQEALRFILSFDLQTNSIQDTKKLAGVIQTGLSVDLLALHITRINSAKKRCKTLITSIKDKDLRKQADLRFYFVHNVCGLTYLVTNELYRNLVQISEPVDSIYFGLEKHNKDSEVLFPKAKATLRNSDETKKTVVRKKHNSLPVFLAENSELLALNKNGKKNAVRYSYKSV